MEIGPEDVFHYTGSTGKLCKTAAVNQEEYGALFRETLREYDAVIHVNISAEFSSCYNRNT